MTKVTQIYNYRYIMIMYIHSVQCWGVAQQATSRKCHKRYTLKESVLYVDC